MTVRRTVSLLAGLVLVATAGSGATAPTDVPYWASIRAGEAKMRAGPARRYPSTWVYRRADLPVKVMQRHEDWRRVEDPDGTQGWILRTLLSERRTVIVRALTTVNDRPSGSAHVNWRVEPGVVARLDECDAGWCRVELAEGRVGHIREAALWGAGEP